MRIQYKKICSAIATGNLSGVRAELRTNPAVVDHWKPLCDAAFYGNSDCIDLLLDAGADPNQVAGTASRHTPLTRITQFHKTIPKHDGHSKSLALLLERGANPGISAGPMNLKPLFYATVGPLPALVDILRTHVDSDIYCAATLYDKSSLDRILSQPTSTSHEDASNRTPLHYVALSGMWREYGAPLSIESAKTLLGHGYEVDAIEVIADEGELFGATPLWYAVAHSQNIELVRFLLTKGANPNPATFAATYLGDLEIVELLHQHGADWNIEFAGRTPIQDLLVFRRTKLVPWLLDHGADVDHRDLDGKTALHVASERGCKPELLQMILDHGGDPEVLDNDGRTPVDLAKENNRPQVVKLFKSI